MFKDLKPWVQLRAFPFLATPPLFGHSPEKVHIIDISSCFLHPQQLGLWWICGLVQYFASNRRRRASRKILCPKCIIKYGHQKPNSAPPRIAEHHCRLRLKIKCIATCMCFYSWAHYWLNEHILFPCESATRKNRIWPRKDPVSEKRLANCKLLYQRWTTVLSLKFLFWYLPWHLVLSGALLDLFSYQCVCRFVIEAWLLRKSYQRGRHLDYSQASFHVPTQLRLGACTYFGGN